MSRSHRTSDSSSITWRSSGRTTGPLGGEGAPGEASGPVSSGPISSSGPPKSRSRERWSSVTIAYRVLTEGLERPVSICEMRLGDNPRRAASSRWLTPWRFLSSRSRSPTSPKCPGLCASRSTARSLTAKSASSPQNFERVEAPPPGIPDLRPRSRPLSPSRPVPAAPAGSRATPEPVAVHSRRRRQACPPASGSCHR